MGRWFAIDPALEFASPYLAMGNNPMLFVDLDGRRTWLEKAGDGFKNAWDSFWDSANQFAEWAQQNGIPSFSIGLGMNSGGQMSAMVNRQAINTNPYGSDQNVITGINNARREYFGQQQMSANYSQQLNNRIMSIPYTSIQNVENNNNTYFSDRSISSKDLLSFAPSTLEPLNKQLFVSTTYRTCNGIQNLRKANGHFRSLRAREIANTPKIKKLNAKGTSVLFFINQASLYSDYSNKTISSDQYDIATMENVSGSIHPMIGLSLITYSTIGFINEKVDEFLAKPEVIMFYNKMNFEMDIWKWQGAYPGN